MMLDRVGLSLYPLVNSRPYQLGLVFLEIVKSAINPIATSGAANSMFMVASKNNNMILFYEVRL